MRVAVRDSTFAAVTPRPVTDADVPRDVDDVAAGVRPVVDVVALGTDDAAFPRDVVGDATTRRAARAADVSESVAAGNPSGIRHDKKKIKSLFIPYKGMLAKL